MPQLSISSQFDAGAIEVVRAEVAHDIQLRIRPDTAAEFAQWFYFCLQGAAGQAATLRFMNASESAYPRGWEGYQVLASEDRQHWRRIDTHYDGTVMTARVTPQGNAIYFAYFEPYSYEQHLDLLAAATASPLVTLQRLGTTVQGRDMSLLCIADPHTQLLEVDKKNVWLIARQHPGETMAEWFIEGFLERLLDADDSVSRTLLQRCNFYVVPHMNPDGAVLGNLRTNAAGANLNREWGPPAWSVHPKSRWCAKPWRPPAWTCAWTCTVTKLCHATLWSAQRARRVTPRVLPSWKTTSKLPGCAPAPTSRTPSTTAACRPVRPTYPWPPTG